jgi:hypothetical protein
MMLGFYSALAGLHWAPTPPGVFPSAKARQPAAGARHPAGPPAAMRKIR